MDAAGFLTNEAWLEEHLRAAEAPASNSDGVPIWEYVGLLIAGTFACLLSHCVEIQGGVSQHIRVHASGTTRATVVAPRLDAGISIGERHEAVRTLHRMARSETHH